MDVKSRAGELKEKISGSLRGWADGMIDRFVSENPSLLPVGKYFKRGVSNMISWEGDRIGKYVDGLLMFIADENGNYDMNMLFDDMYAMLKSMPEQGFDLGLFHGTIGNGMVRVELPSNPLLSALMGNISAVKITKEDFMGLKEMLMQ